MSKTSAAEDGELHDVDDVMEVVVEVCEDAGAVGDVVMTGLATIVTAETVAKIIARQKVLYIKSIF